MNNKNWTININQSNASKKKKQKQQQQQKYIHTRSTHSHIQIYENQFEKFVNVNNIYIERNSSISILIKKHQLKN